jgi:WD40 repeat protein
MRRLLAWLLMLGLAAGLGGVQTPTVDASVPQDAGPPREKRAGKAVLSIDNGGHVGPIGGMAFTPDGKRLVTVGHDHTIQEYDAASGERLRIVRPPSGEIVGERLNAVTFLEGLGKDAGNVLAVAGNGIHVSGKGGGNLHRLFLFHRETGKIAGAEVVGAGSTNLDTDAIGLEALACAPGSPTTATASGENVLIHRHLDKLLRGGKNSGSPGATLKVAGARVRALAFSPDGTRLAAAAMDKESGKVLVWSVDKAGTPTQLADRAVERAALGVTWLPDGKQFLTTHRARVREAPLRLWSADGKPLKAFPRAKLSARFKGPIDGHQVVPRNDGEAILSVHWLDQGPAASQLVLAVDLKTGRSRELFYQGLITKQHPGATEALSPMALSPDRNLLAVAVEPWGSRIAWIDLTGKEKVRFSGGPPTPAPEKPRQSALGWSRDGTTLAWHTRGVKRRNALNLETLRRLIVPLKREDYQEAIAEQKGGFKVQPDAEAGKRFLQISRDGKPVARVGETWTRFDRFTLSPPGTVPAWLAWTDNGNLCVSDPATGKLRFRLRPFKSHVFRMAPSPDGRFLAASSSRNLTFVHRIDGKEKELSPLLTIYVRGQDWVVWTRPGFYAATPGGERLLGWTVNNGMDRAATFNGCNRFSKQLHRPELIPLVLEKGDLAAALAALAAKPAPSGKEGVRTRSANVKVDDLLPPRVEIVRVDTSKLPKVTVTVKAKGSAPGQPVTELHLLMNSRPLPEANYLKSLGKKGKPEHEQTWTLEVPEGKTELSVLARSTDSLAVSDAKVVNYKQPPTSRLFALCVGVNAYKQKKLTLKAACNDARGIAEALKEHCARAPLFASQPVVELLLDEKATRKGMLDALAALRAKGGIKPTDLVVLFFAGHGVKQGREFFLLTQDADVKNLKGTCVSGGDLRKALAAFPCQVLLLLDACHSGAAGGALNAYRPATDEATRAMTDEEVGVVVLAAAMDHEQAGEKDKHGFFARSLIEGLKRVEGVPFNFKDRHVYVHHLFTYAFDRVKDLSEDKQHPSLNLPSTVEPFPLVP